MSLLSAFLRQCRVAPERFALCDGERRLSYRALQHDVTRLGIRLSALVEPGERVAVALDRGLDGAVVILAALQAGACYVPLDIKNPPNRLRFICDDADPQCIVGRGSRPGWLAQSAVWLDIETELPDEGDSALPVASDDPEALAAILYTSGSTGTPKGVALSHRAMGNFAAWAAGTFAVGPGDRIASLAPFHFDLSVFDLFSSLSSGAAVHFVPARLTLSPSRLSAWLAEQGITVFYTVPSLLAFLALKGALATTPLPKLKTILFAGEVFPTPQLRRLCELLPKTAFYNLYGPTETNVCCYWPVARERLRDDRPIPIGIPACGADVKIAENGELLVKSPSNLSGYWQQNRLTEALDKGGYYATGDKVTENEFGEYCYHGRLDRMIKCAGYRVEPAEIEAVIVHSADVIQCGVVGIGDQTSGRRPAAAVVLEPGADLTNVVQRCKRHLPAYMQPCKFIVLESLPCLANGKTDYRALQLLLEHR